MKKFFIILPIVTIAIGAAAFYGGTKYEQANISKGFGRLAGQLPGIGGNGGTVGTRFGNRGDAGFVSGQIIAKDDKSITLKLSNNGGSKIIFFSGSTEIGKYTSGDLNDLAIDQNVMVNGSANSDGSITAQTIQIRPNMPGPSPQQ